MTLEEIQSLWEEDSKIDPDNLHTESLRIPQLHAKYYDIYNKLLLLKKKTDGDYSQIKKDRYEYYGGKSSPEVYVEEPFPYKVRDKEALQRYMDADERLNKVDLKIRYYDVELKFLEEIIKTISNRTFQIKNAIEWNKFQAGYN